MEEEVGDSTEDTGALSSETVGGHHLELLEDSASAYLGSEWVSTLWGLMNLTEDLVEAAPFRHSAVHLSASEGLESL